MFISKAINLEIFIASIQVLLFSAFLLSGCTDDDDDLAVDVEQFEDELALKAYQYGYPLVLMDLTCQKELQSDFILNDGQLTINRFVHRRYLIDHTAKTVARQNNDTLVSRAWLDLEQGPLVMHVPNAGSRYFVVQVLDAWTNTVTCLGSRTTGTESVDVILVGPNFEGTLPEGIRSINCPTNIVWIIGRIQVENPNNLDDLFAVQNQLFLIPLSDWSQNISPPKPIFREVPEEETAVKDELAVMPAEAFFAHVTALMKSNPPAPADTSLLEKLETIGLDLRDEFEWSSLKPQLVNALEKSSTQAHKNFLHTIVQSYPVTKGWIVLRDNIGEYGTNYDIRAAIAYIGLGALPPEDQLYPTAQTDSSGQSLSGEHSYCIVFEAAQLPPVNGFWSLTIYDTEGYLVDNPIDRYAIRSSDQLTFNKNGSLSIIIQPTQPHKDQSNWLPSPLGFFNITMRLYWPDKAALDGTWELPFIERLDSTQ